MISDKSPVPTLSEAGRYWFRLGCVSFGGPAGQIAMMHDELVERRRWISEGRFLHALNYCMVLPGPEAQQLATYIGWLLHGRVGGLIAGGLFVLPSLLLLIALSWLYMAFGHLPLFAGILHGIKPAVIAIVLAAAWRIAGRTLKTRWLWAVAVLSCLASMAGTPFPAIILGAGSAGFLLQRWHPQWLEHHSPAHRTTQATTPNQVPVLLDEQDAISAHAFFTWPRLARTLFAGLAIWLLADLLLIWFIQYPIFADMAHFFTRAALLTFGGAYAVLPYVYQGAVEHYGWLSAAQMLDGLALGETTPGPLIMVVAFVGFVGGWSAQVLGVPLLGGIAGAAVATFFTFLPSFVFIFAGAPFIESTRSNLNLRAPLVTISAAVVGVIVSLAAVLGRHILWPAGPTVIANVDWFALGVSAAAAIALLRYKVGIMPCIGVCAGAGLLFSLLR